MPTQRQLKKQRAAVKRAEKEIQALRDAYRNELRELYYVPWGAGDPIVTLAVDIRLRKTGRNVIAEHPLDLAVRWWVRRNLTDYDRLLRGGWEPTDARLAVDADVSAVLAGWGRWGRKSELFGY